MRNEMSVHDISSKNKPELIVRSDAGITPYGTEITFMVNVRRRVHKPQNDFQFALKGLDT